MTAAKKPTAAALTGRIRALAKALEAEADDLRQAAFREELHGNLRGGAYAKNRAEWLDGVRDRVKGLLREEEA